MKLWTTRTIVLSILWIAIVCLNQVVNALHQQHVVCGALPYTFEPTLALGKHKVPILAPPAAPHMHTQPERQHAHFAGGISYVPLSLSMGKVTVGTELAGLFPWQ
jgi:hypothetical protein